MSKNKEQSQAKARIVRPASGAPSVFSDYIHCFWNGLDVSIRFGKFFQPVAELEPNEKNWIEERAIVTVPWGTAKILRNLLDTVITRYERVHGEIKTDFSEPI